MRPSRIQSSTSIKFDYNASPKAISGRTSYLRVRLEFHRYPQVIAGHCNERAFGPPWSFTSTSTCSWIGHPVSGLLPLTSYALFTLGLPTPPVLNTLSLPVTITRRTILQKVPHQPLTVFECLYAQGFRFYFTPLPGSFSPFPHGTAPLSVIR